MRMLGAVLLLLLLNGCVGMGGCASPAAGGITGLACGAAAGDKAAALELGRRYENGTGVPQNLRRAASLYRSAARPTSGTTYVYSPHVGKNGRGMVLPVRTGPDRPGLAEAKYRLALLYLRGVGVRSDMPRALRLLEEAAAAGFAPAAEALANASTAGVR